MSTATLVNWLKSATELGMLPSNVLESLASELEVLIVPPGCRVTTENTPVTKLYILESGQAERYRRQKAGSMWATGLLPGAVVNLSALQQAQLTDSRIVTITECRFQTITADRWHIGSCARSAPARSSCARRCRAE